MAEGTLIHAKECWSVFFYFINSVFGLYIEKLVQAKRSNVFSLTTCSLEYTHSNVTYFGIVLTPMNSGRG